MYRAHGRAVLAYTRRRADPHDAEEISAEVWAVAWRRLEAVPADDPLPWLLGVARRVLANHRRGQRRRSDLIGRLTLTMSPTAAVSADTVEDLGLREALASLRPTDRELLLLVYWDGLSPGQAAVALDLRPGTLHTRLHRARRRLDEALRGVEDTNAATRRGNPTLSVKDAS